MNSNWACKVLRRLDDGTLCSIAAKKPARITYPTNGRRVEPDVGRLFVFDCYENARAFCGHMTINTPVIEIWYAICGPLERIDHILRRKANDPAFLDLFWNNDSRNMQSLMVAPEGTMVTDWLILINRLTRIEVTGSIFDDTFRVKEI